LSSYSASYVALLTMLDEGVAGNALVQTMMKKKARVIPFRLAHETLHLEPCLQRRRKKRKRVLRCMS